MVNQASAGLFASAIMESGSCTSPQFFQVRDASPHCVSVVRLRLREPCDRPRCCPAQPMDFAIAWNTQYAAAVGCNGSTATAGPAELGDDPTVSCMRTKSTEDVMKSLLDM